MGSVQLADALLRSLASHNDDSVASSAGYRSSDDERTAASDTDPPSSSAVSEIDALLARAGMRSPNAVEDPDEYVPRAGINVAQRRIDAAVAEYALTLEAYAADGSAENEANLELARGAVARAFLDNCILAHYQRVDNLMDSIENLRLL